MFSLFTQISFMHIFYAHGKGLLRTMERWALCYRRLTPFSTSNHGESWHNTLKHKLLKYKKKTADSITWSSHCYRILRILKWNCFLSFVFRVFKLLSPNGSKFVFVGYSLSKWWLSTSYWGSEKALHGSEKMFRTAGICNTGNFFPIFFRCRDSLLKFGDTPGAWH